MAASALSAGWLESASAAVLVSVADRTRMGQGDNRHVRDDARITVVPTGAVLLMRGDLSPHGPGVLHRSPPNPARASRLIAAVDA